MKTTGKELRDQKLDQVTRYNWQREALRAIKRTCRGEMLAEDIRAQLLVSGLPHPHHPNAWGALIMAASKRKLITKTGNYKASISARSHGRHQPIWKIVE